MFAWESIKSVSFSMPMDSSRWSEPKYHIYFYIPKSKYLGLKCAWRRKKLYGILCKESSTLIDRARWAEKNTYLYIQGTYFGMKMVKHSLGDSSCFRNNEFRVLFECLIEQTSSMYQCKIIETDILNVLVKQLFSKKYFLSCFLRERSK